MSKVEQIENEILQLNEEEREALRTLAEVDSDAWDAQIEADAHTAKLDRLSDRALRHHQSGQSTPLA